MATNEKKPKSHEGYDPATGHDHAFHADVLDNDTGFRERVLEEDIKKRNPALYTLLKQAPTKR